MTINRRRNIIIVNTVVNLAKESSSSGSDESIADPGSETKKLMSLTKTVYVNNQLTSY